MCVNSVVLLHACADIVAALCCGIRMCELKFINSIYMSVRPSFQVFFFLLLPNQPYYQKNEQGISHSAIRQCHLGPHEESIKKKLQLVNINAATAGATSVPT